jgi:hypothetical protein
MSSGVHVFRFTLTALFGAILFAAFGTAAIRFASPLWASLTMAVTVPLLFAAILGALFRLGQARAFWTGMAVCGWGYLLLVVAPWFEAGVGQHLPTTYLLGYAHGRLEKQSLERQSLTGAFAGQRLPLPTATGPDAGLVLRTGHALFALLFGFIGGVTAKWFYLTRSPRDNEGRQG